MVAVAVVSAQPVSLEAFWTDETQASLPVLQNKLENLVAKVNRTSGSNEIGRLRNLVDLTHRKMLRSYSTYPTLKEIAAGKYDCLTATVFFSAVLEASGFRFSIIETNYHIFLMVHTTQGDVLLETTDRYRGVETDALQIEKRIGSYRHLLTASTAPSQEVYQYTFDLYRQVHPAQLKGLLIFNEAVRAYNERNVALCGEKLLEASRIYHTPRIPELAAIVLQTLPFSKEMKDTDKDQLRTALMPLAGQAVLPIASR